MLREQLGFQGIRMVEVVVQQDLSFTSGEIAVVAVVLDVGDPFSTDAGDDRLRHRCLTGAGAPGYPDHDHVAHIPAPPCAQSRTHPPG